MGFSCDSVTRWQCPRGHKLMSWASFVGTTCSRCECGVYAGENVMGCRECDWYLCEACLPQKCDDSFWGVITSAFDAAAHDMSSIVGNFNEELEAVVSIITCHAPQANEVKLDEVRTKRPSYTYMRAGTTYRRLEAIAEEDEEYFEDSFTVTLRWTDEEIEDELYL